MPEPGPNVRIDAGLRAGDAVTIHYDPMLAKLIVWDVDRVSAVRRLRKALASIAITGVTSNVDFLGRLSRSPAFGAAELDTGFISQNAASLFVEPQIDDIVVAMAGLGILLRQREAAAREAASSADPHSPWAGVTGFRLNGPAREALCFFIEGHVIELPVTYQRDGYVFECGGATLVVQGRLDAQGKLSAIIDGRKHSGFYLADGQFADLIVGGNRHRIALPDPMHDATDNAAAGGLAAPMPGLVRSILVDVGERVERGQALVVMEAMKMEHTIRAPGDGVVQTLNCMVGAMTEAGVILVEFEPEDG
jgi:3-methylcrotonyl-CoA carboxylase alpha subunit